MGEISKIHESRPEFYEHSDLSFAAFTPCGRIVFPRIYDTPCCWLAGGRIFEFGKKCLNRI